MRIRWTPEAFETLEAIQDFIAKDNPLAAYEVVSTIIDRVEEDLSNHPEMGRLGRDLPDTRELIIAGTPYIVVYMITDNTIGIVQVRHGAQLWPPDAGFPG